MTRQWNQPTKDSGYYLMSYRIPLRLTSPEEAMEHLKDMGYTINLQPPPPEPDIPYTKIVIGPVYKVLPDGTLEEV